MPDHGSFAVSRSIFSTVVALIGISSEWLEVEELWEVRECLGYTATKAPVPCPRQEQYLKFEINRSLIDFSNKYFRLDKPEKSSEK